MVHQRYEIKTANQSKDDSYFKYITYLVWLPSFWTFQTMFYSTPKKLHFQHSGLHVSRHRALKCLNVFSVTSVNCVCNVCS